MNINRIHALGARKMHIDIYREIFCFPHVNANATFPFSSQDNVSFAFGANANGIHFLFDLRIMYHLPWCQCKCYISFLISG